MEAQTLVWLRMKTPLGFMSLDQTEWYQILDQDQLIHHPNQNLKFPASVKNNVTSLVVYCSNVAGNVIVSSFQL